MRPVYSETTSVSKRLWPIFCTWRDRNNRVGEHLIRLVVLYEDLRLEYHAFYADDLGELDETAPIYRRLYFLRRIYMTLEEVCRALCALDASKEFRSFIQNQLPGDRRWKNLVRYFNANCKTIKNRRNAYGGHVDEKTAAKILEGLDTDMTGVLIERRDSHRRKSRGVLHFALELVGRATLVDKPKEQGIEEFVKGSDNFPR